MIGSLSAVQHYNVISRIISTSYVRVFRIPLVARLDDYEDFFKKKNNLKGVLGAIRCINHILGFKIKESKM